MTKDVEHFLKSLSDILVPLLRVVCLGLYSIFLIGLFVILIISFLCSLYILEIRPLSDMGLVMIFFHFVYCHFVLLTMSFALHKLFSFRRSHLLIFSHSVCAARVIFRKWCPVKMHSSVLPTFSSTRFSIAGFMLRSLIHLKLSFVYSSTC